MNEKEQRIYIGLKSIGEELAAFFEDAVNIAQTDYDTKPYILAHLSREIEGGLRQILASTDSTTTRCSECNSEIKPLNHQESILRSLGLSSDNPFAEKWHSTAKHFHRLAHRHGPWKEPRKKEVFDIYWNDFLDILDYLVGNYYSIGDRLDTIIKNDTPSKSVLGTLPNLLNLDAWNFYFYQNLKSHKWLIPLFNNGYFSINNHPSPIEVEPDSFSHPYWSVLHYLENLIKSTEPLEKNNLKTIRLICKQWIKHFIQNPKSQNFRTNHVIFQILCSLPDELLTDKDFEYIESTIRSNTFGIIPTDFERIIKKFIDLKNKELALKTINILFAYKLAPDKLISTNSATSIFEKYYFKKFVEDYSESIIQLCGCDAVEFAIAKIKEIIKEDSKAFNKLTVSAILDEDKQMTFDDRLECQLTFFTRDSLVEQDFDYLDNLIPKLLNEKHPVFKRLAIHVITERYLEFEQHFWSLKDNPIDSNMKLEVFKLFKKCNKHFNGSQFDQILNWIEKKKFFVPKDYSPENTKRSIAASKIEWLQSIESSDNQKVKEALIEQRKINDVTFEHPGHDIWSSGVTIGDISPITIKELSSFNLEEIIQYYNDFKSSHRGFMGPSIEGLARTIQKDVENRPDKYTTNKALLKSSSVSFLDSICDGIRKKLEEEIVPVKLDILLSVIWEKLNRKEYWVLFNKENSENRQFIYSYLWLINQVLRNDLIEVPDTDFVIIKKTLLKIYNEDDTIPYANEDLNMSALNHTKGIIFSAFIEFSLRVKRMDSKSQWDKDIKEIFEKELNKTPIEPLFFNSLGRYLDNIPFIDKDWYESNFDKIFPLNKEEAWSSSFNSHFFYSSNVYQDRFRLFCDHGHFKKSFDKPELVSSDAQNRVCQHILIAYLDNQITLDINDEPLSTLLSIESEDNYENIIRFFWNNNFSKANTKKLRRLWLHIYSTKDKIQDPELANYFLSGCTKWIQHFKHLDDELFEAIKEGATNLAERDRYFFFEDLSKIFDDNLEKGGELLVAAFRKDATYDISRGLIADMVEKLYIGGYKDMANEICELHVQHGLLFLRELYNKYNKK